MHLYLSSYRIGNEPEKLTDLFGENKRTAVIGNARDQLIGYEREIRMQQEHDDLRALGLQTEEVDLRDFFSAPQMLPQQLERFACIWMRGGNTFLLRRALAQSGGDLFLQSLRDDPDFICAGYSAGACVMSPTLQGINLADDPDFSAPPYNPEVIWEGLNFVPYWIVPHYQSDHFESEMMEAVVEFYRRENLPFKTLRDGEALVEKTHV